LELETKEALASQDWLTISSDSILEFLDMDCLSINEADLVRALIRWGNYQMHQNGDDPEANLRSKVLPGLGKIRFGSLTQQELVQLCQEELGKVLSGDEKSSIFMSIISGNWELMPSGVISSTKLTPRHEPYTFCSLPYAADPNNTKKYICSDFQDKYICFRIDKKAVIFGVKLNLSAQVNDRMTFSLHDGDRETAIATGSVKRTSLHRGEVFCPFNISHILHPFTLYSVHFTCNGHCEEHCRYALPKDKISSISDGVTMRIFTSSTFVPLQGLVLNKVVN
jgi:BTB And C-terminal Kelch